jgi:hypothetical protein
LFSVSIWSVQFEIVSFRFSSTFATAVHAASWEELSVCHSVLALPGALTSRLQHGMVRT